MKNSLFVQWPSCFLSILLTLFCGNTVWGSGPEQTESSHNTLVAVSQPEEVKTAVGGKKAEKVEWWDQGYLTGDWGGERTWLANEGMSFNGSFCTDLLGNPTGGRHQAFEPATSFSLEAIADLEKLAEVPGASFYASMIWRAGKNLSAEHIGNILTAAQLYGGPNVRLYSLYWKEVLLDECLTFKIGRLGAFDDFLATPVHWNYVNNVFDGNPKGVFLDVGALGSTVYPTSSWGFFMQGQSTEKDWYAQAGVYGLNSANGHNSTHGGNFTFNFDQGAGILGQGGYRLNMKPNEAELPGLYSMGFFINTDRYSTYDVPSRSEFNNGGLYWMLQQMVYREPGEENLKRKPGAWGFDSQTGLTLWSSIVNTPSENVNPFPLEVNGGLVYQGPFKARPQDFAALGCGWISASDDMRTQQSTMGAPIQDFEMALELNYRLNVTRFFYVQPVVQYIVCPNADGRLPDAVVLGAQIQVTF
ncbi:MAG: carbohydrate porin [Verrucomicrobiae bacterium]|nr:carbohydrate porin [Verrucomicrobiae bacterium]